MKFSAPGHNSANCLVATPMYVPISKIDFASNSRASIANVTNEFASMFHDPTSYLISTSWLMRCGRRSESPTVRASRPSDLSLDLTPGKAYLSMVHRLASALAGNVGGVRRPPVDGGDLF